MQKRPAKKKLPRDVNARAFAIGELATSEAAPEPEPAEPEVKLVRRQTQRQTRSKRTGKR